MLLEFRVKNFRSIRDEQCFSLVADKDKSHAETNLASTGLRGVPHAVRSAVIYGPNASGKSNLIKALAFMQEVVATSATRMREGQLFDYAPFKLDAASAKQPSEFELTFVNGGVRYQYGFNLTPERVVAEWLLVYKTAKAQLWFDRRFDAASGSDHYAFGSHLTGKRALWQESTRGNALFLSKAVDLNSERLRPVFLWIVESLIAIDGAEQPRLRQSMLHAQSSAGKSELLNFLNSADISIADIEFVEYGPMERSNTLQASVVPELDSKASEPYVEARRHWASVPPPPLFVHRSGEGEARFRLRDESTGTRKLFAYAGPILDVLRNSRVLLFDELDGSLHPLIVRFLIGLFHSPENNPHGAQLIFTTHDTSLLSADRFRRDQVWLVEKDQAQATKLYPLTDFSPRKDEALERGYLQGRYGALPFVSDFHL